MKSAARVVLLFGLFSAAAAAEDRRTDTSKLLVMTLNTYWMWDGVEPEEGGVSFPWKGSKTEAEEHMEDIAEIIIRNDPDIVHLVEVENLGAVTTLNDKFLAGRRYKSYLIDGRDTTTGQDVALLTRIDPDGNAIQRDDRRRKVGRSPTA